MQHELVINMYICIKNFINHISGSWHASNSLNWEHEQRLFVAHPNRMLYTPKLVLDLSELHQLHFSFPFTPKLDHHLPLTSFDILLTFPPFMQPCIKLQYLYFLSQLGNLFPPLKHV